MHKAEPDWRTENIVREIRGQSHSPVVVLSKAQAEEVEGVLTALLNGELKEQEDYDEEADWEALGETRMPGLNVLVMIAADVGMQESIGILHQAKKVKEGRLQ